MRDVRSLRLASWFVLAWLCGCQSADRVSRSHAGSGPSAETSGAPSASHASALAGSATRPRPGSPSPSSAPSSGEHQEEPVDFEDEFTYGSAGEQPSGHRARRADPSVLAGPIRYRSYGNERFDFSLEVPVALEAMEAPENGDGQQWRLGSLLAMTASGSNWDDEILKVSDVCPSSSHVTWRKQSNSSCIATGKAKGFIYWQRSVVAHGVMFSLRFQYVESLKAKMDPIVAHVNASWRF